jgi:hypothetical protein
MAYNPIPAISEIASQIRADFGAVSDPVTGATLFPATTLLLGNFIQQTAGFGNDPSAHTSGLWTARSTDGNVMSSRTFIGVHPTASHLRVLWEIRAYVNGVVKILVQLRNGFIFNSATAIARSYKFNVTLSTPADTWSQSGVELLHRQSHTVQLKGTNSAVYANV